MASGVISRAALPAMEACHSKGRLAKKPMEDQRALLFGSRLGKQGRVNENGRRLAELYAANERELLQQQNDELVDKLADKVELLKDTALDIGREARDSTCILEELDTRFDKAMRMMNWSMKHLQDMTKTPQGRGILQMAAFMVFLVFLMYSLRLLGGSGARGFLHAPVEPLLTDRSAVNVAPSRMRI